MTDFTKLSPEDLARVTTRDGRKVEILSTKARGGGFPIIGHIGDEGWLISWSACGQYYQGQESNPHDLILPPAPRVYYANAYPGGVLFWHGTLESTRRHRSSDWLALYKISDDGENATIEVIERNK